MNRKMLKDFFNDFKGIHIWCYRNQDVRIYWDGLTSGNFWTLPIHNGSLEEFIPVKLEKSIKLNFKIDSYDLNTNSFEYIYELLGYSR